MKRVLGILTFILFVGLMSTSCSNNKTRPLEESISAFLNGNEQIISFGSANLKDILNKTEYEKESKVKAFLSEPMNQLMTSMNMDLPVYFAIEGPFIDGNPTATYLFMEVKDVALLKENLTKNGFEIQDAKDFSFVEDGDMNLAFDEKLATILIKPNVSDAKEALNALRKRTQGDVSTGMIASILAKKDDVVIGAILANLLGTSNTDLKKLPEQKQDEFKAMMNNSFIENTLNFEDGAIVFETKNHFSKELQDKLFFNQDGSAEIVKYMGKGSPIVGFSMNLNTRKLQDFLEEFAPEALNELSMIVGGPFAMAMMISNNDISKLVDGKVGGVLVGDATNVIDGMTPDFNVYLGLGSLGKNLGGSIKEFMSDKFEVINLTDSSISGYSSKSFAGSGLKLPEAGEGFGKNTFDFFVNLEGIDVEEFQLEGAGRLIELVKFIKFNYNEHGGKLIVKAKNGKENALKQVFDKLLNVFQDKIA